MEDMKFALGYGSSFQEVSVPAGRIEDVLLPSQDIPEKGMSVSEALENPVASARLRDIVRPGRRIAIITSDVTRPMPTAEVLPSVLSELFAAGAVPEDITVIFALGSHRKQTDEERRCLAGFVPVGITLKDSDSAGCVRLGVTSRGTPVDIDATAARADILVCLGNIEYHYFAGYSGGAKAVMPGISSPEAIQMNHKNMLSPAACAGRLAGNPVREDIEEAGAIAGIDFIVNVVLDEHKKISAAFAGHPVKAHRAGCAYLDALFCRKIARRADIVIASQGGAPKDINLYQTQKALDNAKHAVKNGGIIILVGSCREGFGQPVFEEWLTVAETPGELIARLKENFVLGGHKAAAIAMVLEKVRIFLVSDLPDDLVRSIFMEPFATVQAAFDAATHVLGPASTVTVMPYAGSTLPKCEK